jgi:hypothetical protein
MTGKIKYVLIVILIIVVCDLSAQNSQVLYHMNLPQKHLLNPALTPSNSVYIGLPGISGINVNINNNFINFSDVFMKSKTGDSVISILHPDYEIGKFISKIKDKNSIEPQLLVQLFGLGFRAGSDLYIFFDVNERIEGNFVLPGDILKLALLGNEQFLGDKMDLSPLRGDFKYFREYGLGFSKNFTDRLRIGIKPKFLQGITSLSIENNSLGISVNEDYSLAFDADLAVNMSAPAKAYMNSSNGIDSIVFDDSAFDSFGTTADYLLKTTNRGFGLDIGAEYKLTDRIRVSAAITDLGYIKWRRDITNLKAKSSFAFNGLDLKDMYDREITLDSLAAELADSLKNSFVISDTYNPFTTYLPFGVTVGGSFNLTKSFSLGLVSYTRFIGKQVREALTLSANVNFGNAFSTTLAYTAANHRYDNLGAGLAFRTGWFQFYFLADRIPVSWNKIITDGGTIPLPTSWNTIHARLGMNLAFGNRVKKKNDKPMMVVE